jgi:hypothetical protein
MQSRPTKPKEIRSLPKKTKLKIFNQFLIIMKKLSFRDGEKYQNLSNSKLKSL